MGNSMDEVGHSWSNERILTHLPAARALYAAQKDEAVAFPAPRFISIWLSEICNLDCTYCYFADSNHDPERTFMKTAEIIDWLGRMKTFGAEALEFSGGGEPTVHKDFPKIFEAAADMGYALGLITHACNPMPLELLASRAKYVRCGLDAATPETHAKIKRKNGKFEKAVQNVKDLVRLRNERQEPGFTVGIKVVLNDLNFDELPLIMDMALDLDVDYLQIKHEHSSDNPLSNELLKIGQLAIDRRAELYKDKYRTKILGNLSFQRATTKCFMSPIHTVVSAKGEILQCCFMWDRPIGTIREPIHDVWGSKKHREVIKMTTVSECDKVDCRWNFFNRRMKEVIEDPLAQASFI